MNEAQTVILFLFGMLITIIQLVIGFLVRMVLKRMDEWHTEMQSHRDRLHRLEASHIEHRHAITTIADKTATKIGIL